MPTYRTPDVYVEEISVFPPSVAEVATAVPAFIGYTAKATRDIEGDLKNVPTRITSLLEFEQLFGGAPTLDVAKVQLDEGGNFVRAELGSGNAKHLYNSMRLFFDNGGGPCYIVSVGKYTDSVDQNVLITGLAKVATVDEPTILLAPDAASLSTDNLAAFQKAALAQCGKLGDRVALMDTVYYDNKTAHGTAVEDFRSKVGINSLKYGAAYAPWLKVNYPKQIGYADLTKPATKLYKGSQPVELATLTSEQAIKDKLSRLDKVLADVPVINTAKSGLFDPDTSFSARQDALLLAYKGAKNATNTQNLFDFLLKAARAVDGLVTAAVKLTCTELITVVNGQITDVLVPVFKPLLSLEKELDNEEASYALQQDLGTKPSAPAWGNTFSAVVASSGKIPTAPGTTAAAKFDATQPTVLAALAAVGTVLAQISAAADTYRSNDEAYLGENFSLYRSILRGVNNAVTVCPPSGAIAGIYALVDNQRGVWKAPANVSLNGVLAPTYLFDSDDTDNLNIDANSGKSVNAIRAFAGKGTLVWGARTLAGNDNEWRYVSVRRFYNMVEESVKKSTYWAVFEPNDANTWVKVRGMIENYLTQKWREGALAGASTKDAFFVRCGLGTTMSSQDILEGRLIVEIGMAVVRPAEFIILKFSHKLQTS